MATKSATFAAGCFWGVEARFMQVPGVVETAVGYMGGATDAPTYESVCSDATGHAEVVHLQYDPQVVSFDTLLDTFFNLHDPTQLNRQGPDVGSQYRSAVFFHDPEQEQAAIKKVAALDASKRFRGKIVTRIESAGPFWRAEEYHQKYLQKRGRSECHL